MTSKTFYVRFAATTLLANVYYTFVGIDGTQYITRTNTNVVAGETTGDFKITIASWDSSKIGIFTWDDSAGDSHNVPVGVESYSSLSDATAYFASRMYSVIWSQSAIVSQQQSLNDATRIIDRFAYRGLPTRESCGCPSCGHEKWHWGNHWEQKHTWPRIGIYLDLVPVDPHKVPDQIVEAQYEIALALLKGFDPEREMRNASVVSRGYSSVRVAYNPNLVQDYLRWGVPSGAAWNLMLPFLNMDQDVAVRLHRVM